MRTTTGRPTQVKRSKKRKEKKKNDRFDLLGMTG